MYGVQIAFKDFVASKGFIRTARGPSRCSSTSSTFFSSVNFWNILGNTLGPVAVLSWRPASRQPIVLALMINEVKNTQFQKGGRRTSPIMPYFVSTVVLVGMVDLFFAEDGPGQPDPGALFGAEPQHVS